jgi:hypothetical protein
MSLQLLMEALFAFTDDLALAFILIFADSSIICLLDRYLSPRSAKTKNGQSTYACGEKKLRKKKAAAKQMGVDA